VDRDTLRAVNDAAYFGSDFVADGNGFVWPAAGSPQVMTLPGGGVMMKFTLAAGSVVCAVREGKISKIRNIPTRRIARQIEITIRHEGDFESSYTIVDQTPHSPTEALQLTPEQGADVACGAVLHRLADGGNLHFQLSWEGRLVDPRSHITHDFSEAMSPEA
jgi:hypothetical protein